MDAEFQRRPLVNLAATLILLAALLALGWLGHVWLRTDSGPFF